MTEGIDESPEEIEARKFFEKSLELIVTRVPCAVSKTPDFLIDGEVPGYVLEIKSRFDDESFLKELESEAVAVRSHSIGHDRWTEDSTRKALQQLIGGDPSHDRFWVIWFSVKCLSSPEAMFKQVIGTLYGVRQVVYENEASRTAESRDCLFVVSGVFEKRTALDGAIITSADSIVLCVNEFSDRAEAFQSSQLYKFFERQDALESPSNLEANGGFLSIANRTIDRTNEREVGHYLSQRYNLKGVHILNIKTHLATVMGSI